MAWLLALNPGRATMLSGATAGAAVTVYDALGRRVLAATADAVGTAGLQLPAGLLAGVYVVRCGNKVLRLTVGRLAGGVRASPRLFMGYWQGRVYLYAFAHTIKHSSNRLFRSTSSSRRFFECPYFIP